MKKKQLRTGIFPERKDRKIWMTMKLTGLILLASVMQLSAAVYSQQRVTLNLKDATLIEVFAEINAATGYTFVYNNDEIEAKGSVSMNVTNAPLNEVLDKVLYGLGLKYRIVDNVVVISVLLPTAPLFVAPPPNYAKGKVVNEQGEGLFGASVVIKGSQLGSITDKEGNFSLKNT